MVNIIINEYSHDGDLCENVGNEDIITVLNDNIRMDTTLVEQIEKLTKSNSLLVQHISVLEQDNKELKELIKQSQEKLEETVVEVTILKDYIKTDIPKLLKNNKEAIAKNTIDDLIKVFKSDILNKPVKTQKQDKDPEKPNKNKKHTGRAVTDDEIFIPNKSLRTDWKHLLLEDDGTIINNSKRRFKLPIDLNLLLFIQECDKPHMDRATAKMLMSKYNINYASFGKIIYNLRDTTNFDKIFNKYYTSLVKATFSVKNGRLVVNKTNTNIPLSLAKEWVSILSNTNHIQKKILELQGAYKDYDKNMIRIICESYNKPKLNKLLKSAVKEKDFRENNPSKRRNLIMNGGLL